MKLVSLLSLSLLSSALLFGGNYKVDAAHSSVGFKVRHMMVSNVKGNFTKFDGTFEFDEKSQALKSIDGVIQTASIDTDNAKRDEHLRNDDFFSAQKYPQITFKSTEVKGDKVHGVLTMRGVSKPVVLSYEFGGMAEDAWGNQKVGFTLEGEVNRLDYGIKWNKLIEAGGVAVAEKVKLEIELGGVLQD
ncbi:MAG: polyisoprenoid-binding protein [Campylobacterales bacterium]|nr:polyisoprenoid-binding protein [Campylobacterales bacterium]